MIYGLSRMRTSRNRSFVGGNRLSLKLIICSLWNPTTGKQMLIVGIEWGRVDGGDNGYWWCNEDLNDLMEEKLSDLIWIVLTLRSTFLFEEFTMGWNKMCFMSVGYVFGIRKGWCVCVLVAGSFKSQLIDDFRVPARFWDREEGSLWHFYDNETYLTMVWLVEI